MEEITADEWTSIWHAVHEAAKGLLGKDSREHARLTVIANKCARRAGHAAVREPPPIRRFERDGETQPIPLLDVAPFPVDAWEQRVLDESTGAPCQSPSTAETVGISHIGAVLADAIRRGDATMRACCRRASSNDARYKNTSLEARQRIAIRFNELLGGLNERPDVGLELEPIRPTMRMEFTLLAQHSTMGEPHLVRSTIQAGYALMLAPDQPAEGTRYWTTAARAELQSLLEESSVSRYVVEERSLPDGERIQHQLGVGVGIEAR